MMVAAILGLTIAVAALVQGTIGVGFALIVAPVVALSAPEWLPGSLLILMLPLNAWIAWRERRHFDFVSAGWITIGRAAGTFAGLWVLVMVSTTMLNLVIGVTTIVAAITTKVASYFSPGRSAFVGAGIITGITETATGIGGPTLALVYQHSAAASLRATIALCFLVGELFSVAVLVFDRRVNISHLENALFSLPALVLGLVVSHWAAKRISPELMRNALLAFATVSGVVLVIQAAVR
jgi:uncharacterized membrane protein YfcA